MIIFKIEKSNINFWKVSGIPKVCINIEQTSNEIAAPQLADIVIKILKAFRKKGLTKKFHSFIQGHKSLHLCKNLFNR